MNIDLVEITLAEDDDFLKVKETLTRIGVSSVKGQSKEERQLFQSCHILHKKGRYYIVHFKELFSLDGRRTNFDDNDLARRNTIANLLDEWGLCTLVDSEKTKTPVVNISSIKIIPFKQKNDWTLVAKYEIGGSKNYNQ